MNGFVYGYCGSDEQRVRLDFVRALATEVQRAGADFIIIDVDTTAYDHARIAVDFTCILKEESTNISLFVSLPNGDQPEVNFYSARRFAPEDFQRFARDVAALMRT
jgi:hypothetical protein